ncbi:MAG: gliding motility-associated C-terminal domain-containing protein [Bacteroidota bacterium]
MKNGTTKYFRNTAFLLGTVLLSSFSLLGQRAFHNFGDLRVHENANVGFHLDLTDDGSFDDNQGLVGFYSDTQLTISGNSHPVFSDMEVFTQNGLFLQTWVGVRNNVNFISGDIITSKANSDTYLLFYQNAFATSADDTSHINGYAAVLNGNSTRLPTGDGNQNKAISIETALDDIITQGAYFSENPNFPRTFAETFSTDNLADPEVQVNTTEFWKVIGELPIELTLNWNSFSAIANISDSTERLVLVGWNRALQQWVNLGATLVSGDLDSGILTSDVFVPDDYEILTLGSAPEILEPFSALELDNYFITPNNDGVNDFLVIDGIENAPNNNLTIFDRYGIKVYEKEGYNNEFDGRSNRGGAINGDSGLAVGIYYYIFHDKGTGEKFQGYLYLTN